MLDTVLRVGVMMVIAVWYAIAAIFGVRRRSTVMDDAVDPLVLVRSSCQEVVRCSRHVLINDAELKKLAETIVQGKATTEKGVQWDEFDWHYVRDARSGGPLTCQYVFVLDALNFCFWPSKGFEYENLARCLKSVLERDSKAFSGDTLASVNAEVLRTWAPNLPNLGERAQKLRELGSVLRERYHGMAINMVKEANGSAVTLVRILIDALPGFRDTAVYPNDEGAFQVFLYKRAQILVADIWAAYGKRGSEHRFGFSDVERLTTFADYRVPQLLNAHGVLEYSAVLAARIESLEELSPGSEEEVEIRAATVVAVDRLRDQLQSQGLSLTAVEVDWLLWQMGESGRNTLKPHHRTRTIFY